MPLPASQTSQFVIRRSLTGQSERAGSPLTITAARAPAAPEEKSSRLVITRSFCMSRNVTLSITNPVLAFSLVSIQIPPPSCAVISTSRTVM